MVKTRQVKLIVSLDIPESSIFEANLDDAGLYKSVMNSVEEFLDYGIVQKTELLQVDVVGFLVEEACGF